MKPLVDPDIEQYAHDHTRPRPALFDELREQTYASMSSPHMQVGRVEGTLLELLCRMLGARRVLEIGTGCGYQAAVLGRLASEVYSIERLRGLHDRARDNLRPLRIANVHLLFGDGMAGYPKGAPYAGIIAAAGGEAVPQAWIEQLADGVTAQALGNVRGVDSIVVAQVGIGTCAQ